MRTIRRHGKVIGALPPQGIGYQLVHHLVSRGDSPYFHLLGDRGNGNGFNLFNRHLIGSGDGDKTVAKEGASWTISGIAGRVRERISQYHPGIRYPEVQAMHAPFRAIHPAALGAVAIIQQLGREAFQHRALLRVEHERRNTGAVLTEIDYQLLARLYSHRLPGLIFLFHDDFSVSLVTLIRNAFPHVSLHGSEGQVVAEINLGTVRGHQLALELIVHFRNG